MAQREVGVSADLASGWVLALPYCVTLASHFPSLGLSFPIPKMGGTSTNNNILRGSSSPVRQTANSSLHPLLPNPSPGSIPPVLPTADPTLTLFWTFINPSSLFMFHLWTYTSWFNQFTSGPVSLSSLFLSGVTCRMGTKGPE